MKGLIKPTIPNLRPVNSTGLTRITTICSKLLKIWFQVIELNFLILGVVKNVTGSYIVKHHPDGPDTERVVEIDFTPPFKRIHMIKGLEEKLGEKIPEDLTTPEANA